MRARFDRFMFDSTTRSLLRGGETLHVSTKAFDLLQQLVGAAPRVLTKRQILDQIWPGTYVSDGTLAAVVGELRAVLGDSAREPKFIRTVHRIGYSFCGEVDIDQKARTDRACRLVWGGREIHLAAGSNIL